MKTPGDAQTTDEFNIESVIRRVPDLAERAIRYSPVSGGISNSNWRVEVANGHEKTTYFLKVPGIGTEMFIDRRTAHEASVRAAECGYGAPVFSFMEDCGVEIFEFMEGWHSSSNLDFLNGTVRHNALRALKAFNDQPLLTQTKTVFNMIDEHEDQRGTLRAACPLDHEWLCRQYARARRALEASGVDLAPCMNDTLAGNFMLDAAHRVMLVDFEYASNNDRYYELAMWFGEMFFDEQVELELIEEYFGRVGPREIARVQLYKALADLKWSAWAMVQRSVSRIDFDFYKYGIWKYMRARTVMQDIRWESWLRQV